MTLHTGVWIETCSGMLSLEAIGYYTDEPESQSLPIGLMDFHFRLRVILVFCWQYYTTQFVKICGLSAYLVDMLKKVVARLAGSKLT
jgi:hypothetical protein